jgi:hypothetical protein
MPAVSKKQERFMQAVANNPAFAKKVGVPQSVGREFTKKEGGTVKESKAMMKKEVAFMKKKGAPKSMVKHEMSEAGMEAGGVTKKMPTSKQMGSLGMKSGGKVKKYAAGGLTAGHKAADGIAKKGKTKGKQVAMRKGGYC